jgi:hypothetical protein
MKIDELLKRLENVEIKERRVMKSLKQMFNYAKRKEEKQRSVYALLKAT